MFSQAIIRLISPSGSSGVSEQNKVDLISYNADVSHVKNDTVTLPGGARSLLSDLRRTSKQILRCSPEDIQSFPELRKKSAEAEPL